MSDTMNTNELTEQSEKQRATPSLAELDLRDYFAAMALPAVYRVFCDDIRAFETTVPEGWREGIALDAYALADAMLKVRGEQ